MGESTKVVAVACSLAVLAGGLSLTVPQTASAADAETIKKGKEVAVDRRKGNCLACHMMDDGEAPGNIGPPLVAMKARFPDPAKLRAQIYNPMSNNPNTRMPPYGLYGIVSDDEIDAIVAYLYTL
jgi:sulfur-oxidizing protein SoxX